jgi:tetratricopeptide (TPR) repeat protein
MGEKRAGNGKHLFIYGACLLVILSLGTGCVTSLNIQERWQGHKHLDLAETLISKGEYEGALKEYEEIVRLFPGVSPGDKALFHMGLIWAHPNNLQRNYKKALECFHRLLRDFPRTTLKDETRVWVSVLNKLILCESKITYLEKTVNTLEKQQDTLKEIDIRIEKKKREDSSDK